MSKPYHQSAYPKYNRLKKKFPPFFRKELNKAEDQAALNPWIGEEKAGELKGIRVYKFKILDLLVLLAYQVNKEEKEVVLCSCRWTREFLQGFKEAFEKEIIYTQKRKTN